MSQSTLDSYEPACRIRMVCENASQFEMDPSIPAKRYFRSTVEMERMARVYIEEGKAENALILYMRLISIIVEKLPKHPHYGDIPAQDISSRKKLITMRCWKERADCPSKIPHQVQSVHGIESDYAKTSKNLVATIFPTAEKLKTKLKEQYGKEYERLQKKQEADAIAAAKLAEKEKEELDKQPNEEPINKEPLTPSHGDELSTGEDNGSCVIQHPAAVTLSDYGAPPLVSHQALVPGQPDNAKAKLPNNSTVEPKVDVPKVDRSIKPEHLIQKQDSLVQGLRRVHYPRQILSRFLDLASRNTTTNVETCGVLCGKLSHDRFVITHLVLLKQTGTADSCTTLSEEELFDVQDQNDLITLGWIHTHPSQTSFLSSVDLHTQFSYQQLLPEAIAVVCAPKYQQIGVYCLTPDHGMPTIAACRLSGFHPHAKIPPLFKDCDHVTPEDSFPLAVVDLR